jgi:hypothetical protein
MSKPPSGTSIGVPANSLLLAGSVHYSTILQISVNCLMLLSVSRLYSTEDKMVNEYGAIGRMRIGREN